MKRLILFCFLMIFAKQHTEAQNQYDQYPTYKGNDLGLTYTSQSSLFRIWSPPAAEVELRLYKQGTGGHVYRSLAMTKSQSGTWVAKVEENLKGVFYTIRTKINGKWNNEVTDPYARAVGINGQRAMVVDLKDTNPDGWNKDRSPDFSDKNLPTDAIIYELHIRDATIHPSSGVKQKGKFLGLAETGTQNTAGLSTGLDHIKELGVTHVHLLPFYDYNSVDETKTDQYNWGYDPVHYNVPEGSYSTNAADGLTRIRELKQMIQAFHKKGLRVVMDVVYNHTALTETSNFNQLVPGYYYRQKADGSFSDATACGNETASEREMFRKFMLESVLYWVKEYHIDGFRFDLMGVHDIKTMNLISDTLHKIKPDILLYGEGWTAGASPYPEEQRAVKKNAHLLKGIAVFSDDIRDGIKGSVFDIKDRGFATGKTSNAESVKFGIVASGKHVQIDMRKVNYSKEPYTSGPDNVITYAECHDNNILWDKIALSVPEASEADRKKMHELALTIVLTSQGIPFLHAGSEFLRSKFGEENSYNKGDSVNAIRWDQKTIHCELNHAVKKLIELRKSYSPLRMNTQKEVNSKLQFLQLLPDGVIAYIVKGRFHDSKFGEMLLLFNGSADSHTISVPNGIWIPLLQEDYLTTQKPLPNQIKVAPFSSLILIGK
ncbi:type I pullulanase [Sediminibacterium sp.]|uniref:type I pullulanase n=1 Tax=Sediminibacterium sp. TaxID=1917865 RepID=UPI0025FC76AD|nr:type I pullulanase [Sediminibacterium sp.]MBW0177017.1 type I pullulanase [Sediminibacterium sp.]